MIICGDQQLIFIEALVIVEKIMPLDKYMCQRNFSGTSKHYFFQFSDVSIWWSRAKNS